ncbi:transmembrane proteins 14C-domain-containing protein [Lipomyces arxii]|uniref:transmembrane proteins 14C-domain-containing protein n=1 Tax=Lipomyces arxii TaxID=56418 RepID=UPI0034CD2B7A
MEHPAFTLAALCTIGGVVGYGRKKSIPSLAGGLATGIVFGVAGYLLKENKEYGIHTALLGSLLLIGASVPRAIKVKKPVPIGLSFVGLAAGTYYAQKYQQFYM